LEKRDICSFLKAVLIIEGIGFLIGGTFVTNMHPVWMQQAVVLNLWLFVFTAIAWLALCWRSRNLQSRGALQNTQAPSSTWLEEEK